MAETIDQAPKDLFGFLDFYLVRKAPFQIPDAGREWIVRYGPWIAVVLLLLSIPALLLILGVGTLLLPFGGAGYAVGFGYASVFLLVQSGLRVAALPGLFARKMTGWNLMFYAAIVGLVGSLLIGAFISGVVGLVISLYILFQVRSLYH